MSEDNKINPYQVGFLIIAIIGFILMVVTIKVTPIGPWGAYFGVFAIGIFGWFFLSLSGG